MWLRTLCLVVVGVFAGAISMWYAMQVVFPNAAREVESSFSAPPPPLRPVDDLLALTNVPPGRAVPRVVFAVLSIKKNHQSRLQALLHTWGKHAKLVLVASDEPDPQLDSRIVAVPGDARHLGLKTIDTLHRLCSTEADFYVLTDDDTFVVVHNLESALRAYDPMGAWYMGYLLTHIKPPFIGGGGGIVLSRGSLQQVCRESETAGSPCSLLSELERAGDVAISRCMEHLHIKPTHLEGFYPFPPHEMVKEGADSWCRRTWWLPKHIKCPPIPKAITFHYVEPQRFKELHYWAYRFEHAV